MTNPYQTVGSALTLLTEGLAPFVEKQLEKQEGENWQEKVQESYRSKRRGIDLPGNGKDWDAHSLLMVVWDRWNIVFRPVLGHQERSLVSELREFRNQWAHQKEFSFDDTYRILDSATRLLDAVKSPQAKEIHQLKERLMLEKLSDEHDLVNSQEAVVDAVPQGTETLLKKGKKSPNKYLVITLYLICAITIIIQLYVSWNSRAYVMIGFVVFLFSLLIYERARDPQPKKVSREQ